MIYGTAWKYDKTADLVQAALRAGFLEIDSASQLPQYREDLVGVAIQKVCTENMLSRQDIWIQSKFTPCENTEQASLPYDKALPLKEQVHSSVKASLQHLKTDYLDSYLLHIPLSTASSTFAVWDAMEDLVPGSVRSIGLSNVPLHILQRIYDRAKVKPSVVQNPFKKELSYDVDVRMFCEQHNIRYQAFGVLKGTGGSELLSSKLISDLATEHKVSKETTLYMLIEEGLRIDVLNGTTDTDHLINDVRGMRVLHDRKNMSNKRDKWSQIFKEFTMLLGVGAKS